MHLNDFDYFFSFEEEEKMLKEHLTKDLSFYNFNLSEWEVDLSKNLDEGGQFEYSDIGIINKETKEYLGGWSDYISTFDIKELYIFWDDLDTVNSGIIKKYKIRKKRTFGVPVHIQKQFSDKLKQEIIDEKHCGSTRFFRSIYLEDVIKKLLQKKGGYYKDAVSFLKEIREHVPYEEKLAKYEAYAAVNEWMKEKDWKEQSLKETLFEYYSNSERKKFIKYDRRYEDGRFLIINDKKEILEYWQFPEDEFDEYVKNNKLIKVNEEEFRKIIKK